MKAVKTSNRLSHSRVSGTTMQRHHCSLSDDWSPLLIRQVHLNCRPFSRCNLGYGLTRVIRPRDCYLSIDYLWSYRDLCSLELHKTHPKPRGVVNYRGLAIGTLLKSFLIDPLPHFQNNCRLPDGFFRSIDSSIMPRPLASGPLKTYLHGVQSLHSPKYSTLLIVWPADTLLHRSNVVTLL